MNVAARTLPLKSWVKGNPFSGRATSQMAIALYVLAAGLTILAYFVLGDAQSGVAFVLASALSLAALVAGPLLHRPANAMPWRWLAAGQAAFLIGNLARFTLSVEQRGDLAWLSDVGYVGYLLLAIGLMTFIRVRRPRYRISRLVDGLVIGCVAGLVIWVEMIGPAVSAAMDPTQLLGLVVTPVFDALLLGGTVYLVIAGGGLRGRAQQLLLFGAGLTVCADLIYTTHVASTGVAHVLVDTLWMASYLFIGLTALTPSMRLLTEPHTEQPERAAGRGMMALAGTLAVLVALNVAQKLTGNSGGVWVEAAEAILVVLLILRGREATRYEVIRERRVATLLANAAEALTVVGADGNIQLANPASARMFGVPYGSSIGRPVAGLVAKVHPEEQDSVRRRLGYVLATPGSTERALIRVQAEDGTYRSIDVTAVNRLADPAVEGVVLNFHDVTDQVRATSELRRLGTAIEQTYDAVLITDPEGNIEYVNPAFERITGYDRDDVIGRNPRVLKSGEQSPAFYSAMWQTLISGKPWRADFVNRRKDGTHYRMAGVITPLHDESGRNTGFVGVSRDLTRQHELESSARAIARQRALIAETLRSTDASGTPEEISHSICTQIAQLEGVATSALVVFEADGRAIPYGIATADGRTWPRRRLPRRRVDDTRAQASRGPWIEKWEPKPWHPYNELLTDLGVRAIAYAPVRSNSEVVGYLLASCAMPNAEATLLNLMPALMEFADISSTVLGLKIVERTQAGAARQHMSSIIDKHEFFPVYQPLYDVTADRVVGYEALTRFEDGVPPDLRFAEAYEAGMGERLELAAVEAALEGAAAIPAGLWLNINATPALVMNDGLQRLIGLADRELVLEVTEHSEITDYQAFRRALLNLGPRVRLAVDDAGSGFASLRHILELRPAFVKLDRQVIAGIDQDEARQAMVAGLRHFAENTGCWLIAEGVETAAELRTLRELDVRYAQGYLLGRPQPAARLEADAARLAGGADRWGDSVEGGAAPGADRPSP